MAIRVYFYDILDYFNFHKKINHWFMGNEQIDVKYMIKNKFLSNELIKAYKRYNIKNEI